MSTVFIILRRSVAPWLDISHGATPPKPFTLNIIKPNHYATEFYPLNNIQFVFIYI